MRITRVVAAIAFAVSGAALAGNAPGPLADPWFPPGLAKQAKVSAPLPVQVEARLRAPFDAAARDGVLTREQATAAGLGFIAKHFDAIDRGRTGAIRFEDYKRFLKERGAALD